MVVFRRLLSNWYAFIKDAPFYCHTAFLNFFIIGLKFRSIISHLDNDFDLFSSSWLKIRIAIMVLIICIMQLSPRLALLNDSLVITLRLTNQLSSRLSQHLLHTIACTSIFCFYFAIDDHLLTHDYLGPTLHTFLGVGLIGVEVRGVVTTDCGGTVIYEGASIRDFLATRQLCLPRQSRCHLHLICCIL